MQIINSTKNIYRITLWLISNFQQRDNEIRYSNNNLIYLRNEIRYTNNTLIYLRKIILLILFTFGLSAEIKFFSI